ncbi:MAG: sulfatase modifying factor 1 [Pseudohongiellaceae bacterium]|jgi:sulfatase modifying factor 1
MSNSKDLAGGFAFVVVIALVDNLLIIEDDIDTSAMIWLDSAKFVMGSDSGMADETPAHQLDLSGFWMDKFEVSNDDYQKFVKTTDYVTYSEKIGDSLVFESPKQNQAMRMGPLDWWKLIKTAHWRKPQGSESSIDEKADHPVVHVNYDDALAYCDWLDKELPTEAQFEYAARGGKEGNIYSWGNQPLHLTEAISNTWQGDFPNKNSQVDGFPTTAPVGSFPANDFGFHDITGNVWEWVGDWYHPQYYSFGPSKNPAGVDMAASIDPNEPNIPKRSIRGGSFLCADDYCSGFRVSARMPADPTSATNHTGFRCVSNPSAITRLFRG